MLGVGRRDIKNFAANLMMRMFLDEIGENYSLTGKSTKDKSGKEPFIKSESFCLVYGKIMSILSFNRGRISSAFLGGRTVVLGFFGGYKHGIPIIQFLLQFPMLFESIAILP